MLKKSTKCISLSSTEACCNIICSQNDVIASTIVDRAQRLTKIYNNFSNQFWYYRKCNWRKCDTWYATWLLHCETQPGHNRNRYRLHKHHLHTDWTNARRLSDKITWTKRLQLSSEERCYFQKELNNNTINSCEFRKGETRKGGNKEKRIMMALEMPIDIVARLMMLCRRFDAGQQNTHLKSSDD